MYAGGMWGPEGEVILMSGDHLAIAKDTCKKSVSSVAAEMRLQSNLGANKEAQILDQGLLIWSATHLQAYVVNLGCVSLNQA